ncbi:hypothetical protein LINGRAHAP2_LOCUS15712 [Linum grandiflorum]
MVGYRVRGGLPWRRREVYCGLGVMEFQFIFVL